MRILVDTPIWSLALRRRKSEVDRDVRRELASLIEDGRVELIGPVRQELLSGIKEAAQFTRLSEHLRAFPDLEITTGDYEEAASFFNLCRARRLQGSNTDFLICAVAVRHGLAIFTTDRGFRQFANVLPITLHTAARHT